MAALVLIGLPVVLLCLGVPIFVALIAAASIGIVTMNIGSMAPVHVALFGGLDNFPLLAVPLFIFAGEVMGRGGIARRLVEWALSIVGGVRGSLALATVASSELFGSMSGSSVGCVAAIGRLMVPELTRRGYTAPFAGSLIASCGAIATIIPPSITMIIFGIAAQQSVPKLFLAGIVPGLLIGVLVSIYLLGLRAGEDDPAHRVDALEEHPGVDPRRRLGAVRPGGDPGRHLWRHLHADGGGGDRLHLRHPGGPLHLQRDVVDRAVADRGRLRQGDLADPDHRVGGRRLFMADHDQRLSDRSSSAPSRAFSWTRGCCC